MGALQELSQELPGSLVVLQQQWMSKRHPLQMTQAPAISARSLGVPFRVKSAELRAKSLRKALRTRVGMSGKRNTMR
ncbi:hypothetical protein NC651_012504 [Populus alba x Populus x berolinensis]|nr:hypothetical protein NC651_012504 [Populus alba x Populus x berolinensis]